MQKKLRNKLESEKIYSVLSSKSLHIQTREYLFGKMPASQSVSWRKIRKQRWKHSNRTSSFPFKKLIFNLSLCSLLIHSKKIIVFCSIKVVFHAYVADLRKNMNSRCSFYCQNEKFISTSLKKPRLFNAPQSNNSSCVQSRWAGPKFQNANLR